MSDHMKSLQERLDKMQAQFEEQFRRVEGSDMDTTHKLIEENNKKIYRNNLRNFSRRNIKNCRLI